MGPGTRWLDTSAFRLPVAGTLGNSGVGVVRGPGLRQFSLSLQKYFPVTESKRFELRGEFYNLTNTPIFGAPVRNVSAANFGEITGLAGRAQHPAGTEVLLLDPVPGGGWDFPPAVYPLPS